MLTDRSFWCRLLFIISVCEEPLYVITETLLFFTIRNFQILIHVSYNSVSSGGQGMYFYWDEDQLLVNQGPTGDNDIWTTFLLDTKEPLEVSIYSHIKIIYIKLLHLINISLISFQM